ncbi:hypothetical protein ACLMJK_003188 [Lecanora helva]
MTTIRPEPKWPPRSPHEALLSSPTGRQRVRQYSDRTSPSPSPLKKSIATQNADTFRTDGRHKVQTGSDEEEDEETLQLQLAAIEAKLKLKKLREKKNGPSADGGSSGLGRNIKAELDGKENFRPSNQTSSITKAPELPRPRSSTEVQIPLSPQRKRIVTEEAKSPGRVLLGIDKGLKGRNISLRRPIGDSSKDDDPFQTNSQSCNVSNSINYVRTSRTSSQDGSSRPKSFSEKIAETRRQDKALKERADNVRKHRSAGFGVNQQDLEVLNSAAESKSSSRESASKPGSRKDSGGFSREEVLEAANKVNSGQVRRSNTSASIRHSKARPSTDIWLNPNAPPEILKPPADPPNPSKKRSRSSSPTRQNTDPSQKTENSDQNSSSLFEPFSSLHLSKRLLPHDFLTRTFSGKHIFLLPDLLGTVKSPDFILPDIEEPDYIVLATIASKSSPLSHKGTHRTTSTETTSTSEAAESEQNNNGKYMVLTLTNLKWTIDLFLFSTGYTRFRKLIPGTVVALLNPDIMPPPPGRADTGRFSLKLSSSDDTVLEIGTSRDLGWCKSVKRDGKQCDSWIDKRHTEFCEFHVDAVVERTRRGRMEVQGMSAPFAPGGKRGGRTGYFGDGGRRRGGQKSAQGDGFLTAQREGPQYDRGSSSRYFVAPSIPGGQSAAQLLDAEGATDRFGSREERVRKRLAEREKENDIAKRLGEGGNGAGSEYLRLKQGLRPSANSTASSSEPANDPVDAVSLGLLGNNASNIHLSPIKKRKAGVMLEGHGSPRKKTRFVTERGIREAGRESFGKGVAANGQREEDDDDEDGLEVI